jgi:hypothetical protein
VDDRDRERLEELPEHESRAIEGESVGGGVVGEGGTAVDRGTGTLGGTAQGVPDEADDATVDPVEDETGEERVKGLTEVAGANRLERGDVDVRP